MKQNLKIAFIGIGSIAKRHIKNLVTCLKKRQCMYQIDVVRSGKGASLSEDLSAEITDYYIYGKNIPQDYDIIFVTNPTSMHYETIQKYGCCTKSMFIEKPVFDNVDVDITKLGLQNIEAYYVACPLRYTNVIQFLKQRIDISKVFSARAICSSYLPEWRPETDYRRTYSAHKALGGGVSIDLIHEWDYMTYLFGMPDQTMNMKGKYSNLEIDSDDCSIYIAKNQSMLYELHLDYFGRKRIRQIELFLCDDTIVGDIEKSEIRYLHNGKVISFKERRNDFQMKEISNFLDVVCGNVENENNIETALKVLRIAKGE